MANYSGISAVSETLTASTVDNVSLSNPNSPGITVLNRSGTAEIYITYAAGTSDPSAPTVGGANCIVLPAAIDAVTVPASAGPVVVALISAGTPSYSVVALG